MKMPIGRNRLPVSLLLATAAGVLLSCVVPDAVAQQEGRRRRGGEQEVKPLNLTPDQVAQLTKVANERKLNVDDLLAAAKTFMPSGRHDEYVLFSSGGQSGQVFAIGVPSMRLLRSISVFTPESWQGYGFAGEHDPVIESLKINGKVVAWGDTHHPALSETKGDYDGEFLFIGDKANARVAVIDLRDWETKQIVKNPLTISDHGAAFVTPNTDYIIEGGQYATVLGYGYAPPSEYKDSYRGMVTMWKFDRMKGRIDESQSFALELPPYWQDLADAGKNASDGFFFINSFNVEMATGGVEKGNPPFEAGASKRDMDYLHIVDWKKAEAAFKAGKFEKINGFPVIKIETSIAEGILYFAPEPKSPHGVDVTPNGKYMVVAGKLDPHVTVYSIDRIKKAIAEKMYSGTDEYGVPILNFDAVKEAQVELGLGPLHTQFDDKGYAYTSLFLDSAVARWTLGGEYDALNDDQPWKLVQKTPVQYNIGHLCAAEGDTVSPDGKYLISMSKWSVDRFLPTGPLLPQNFQLLDIAQPGTTMPVIYDSPIGVGEPHYCQMIKADKLKTWKVYPEVGWNPHTQRLDANAPKKGSEGVVRDGNKVTVNMTAVRSHFSPEHVEINEGDEVTWRITAIETAQDATHGFCIGGYNVNLSLEPGEYVEFRFTADRAGTYPFYCTEFCSALHLEMMGYLHIKPKASAQAGNSPD
ncbi:MAG: Sec-dependent nitrous-oxide reductase [Phycisphaeraceae bacterium]|nr:Sec-dependent nitrous-oxide reductase [Phycisphaeraceae bacterium]MCW5769664.1 Sec-dependent nitrous-oxide reductase [Phycisphaeraceae bacterium]